MTEHPGLPVRLFPRRPALAARPVANDFFGALKGANRYAVLYRIQQAKTPATRAKRIAQFVAMLARGETVHGKT